MKKRNMKFKKLLAILLVIMTTVAFTPAIAFEAFAESEELTLELADPSKTEYIEGEAINIIASGTSEEDAWVGLYKKGDTKDSTLPGGVVSFCWEYLKNIDGQEIDITGCRDASALTRGPITSGDYELVLFGDGGFTDIRKVIEIKVIPDPTADVQPSDELTLKLVDESKTTYKIGEPINIRATGTADGAWVGLYKEGASRNPETGGVTSYRWYYVNANNGHIRDISSASFDSNNWGSIPEGSYEIFLFGDGGYDNVLVTIPITIEGMIEIDESQFSLETDKTDYGYKEDIKVKATGTGIAEGAWVGLFYAGTQEYANAYLYYYYVKDAEGRFVAIQKRTGGPLADGAVGDGSYDVVLFADGGYSFPVKKTTITVTRDTINSKVIREPSCTTFGLQYVVYEDYSSEYKEIQTLGGHDWSAPVHVNGTDTHKYTCKRNSDHKAKVEDCKRENGKLLAAATTSADGKKEFFCDVCNTTYTVAIPKINKTPELSYTSLAYNGKNRKPAVKDVYNAEGNVISKDNYTVTYPSKCKAVGIYKATVKFKGDYAGTHKITYKIVPKAVKLSKVARADNAFKATWKKASSQTTGYQIKYSTNKDFKKAKTKKVKGIKKTSTTVKKLKNKKTYYVSVRTYKVVKGKTYYSNWSASKKVKTK